MRVIDENGTQLGDLDTEDALRISRERNLDLVEVSPNAAPPVCKIMDYGKYKYAEHKKKQNAKRKQHKVHLKEIRLRPRTDKHDVEVKVNRIKKFLEKGDKVIVTVVFRRGREMAHKEIGHELIHNVIKQLEDVAKTESQLTQKGTRFSVTLAPKSKG